MFGIGYPELIVIFLLALIVLGPRKLPEIARAIGRGIRELQKVMHGLSEEINHPLDDLQKPSRPEAPRFLPDDPTPASPDEPDTPAQDEQQDETEAGSPP